MPNVPATEFRSGDRIANFTFSGLAAGTGVVAGAAGGFRLFQTDRPIRIVDMTVVTGTGTITGNTLTAAYGVNSAAQAVLGTTIGTAITTSTTPALAASTVNTVPIESVSSTDTTPRDVIPTGAFVGFNYPSVSSNPMTIISATVRYRDA